MVAREAEFNAVGSPARVEVTLAYGSNELMLRVADDGCGFENSPKEDKQRNHFGLTGMRERM